MANEGNGSTPAFKADAAIALLQQIVSSIPGFEAPDPKVWRRIARKGGYPKEYVEAAENMVNSSRELQLATHFDADVVGSRMELSTQLRELITQTKTFLAGLRFTDAKLRSSVIDACDQVYVTAPGIARKDKALRLQIQAMRQTSRRRGGRKKEEAPPDVPPVE